MRLLPLHPIEQQAPSLSRCVGKRKWRETLAVADQSKGAEDARKKSRCRWGHMHLQALLLPGRNHASVVGAVSVALHVLLPILLMNLKERAANCFMRDSICDCDGAKGFLLLHHTMYYCWPLISGNAVFWVIGLGRRFLMRRVASLQEFIFC